MYYKKEERIVFMAKKRKVKKNATESSKKNLVVIGSIIAGFLLIAFLLIGIESAGKNRLVIENNTSKNLEYVKLNYASYDTDYADEVFYESSISAKETVKEKTATKKLFGTEARLFVTFKFEGEEEKSIDNGMFNSNFSGKTMIEFNETSNDVVTMDVSIKEGLFGNGNNECDEHWEYDFSEAAQ